MGLAYLDFDVEIGPGIGREHPLEVRSPAGEARVTMRFPFDELQLDSRLKDLQIALLRSGGKRRMAPTKEEQTVQDFGLSLFDALMTGDVRSLYDQSRAIAASTDQGLRLRLRIASPQLASLPWEFLYDPRRNRYVCLSVSTPIVRYIDLPQPPQPLAVTPPLRILGMIASPGDLPVLDVAREKARVEQALQDLASKGLVQLEWLEGQTWRDLQRAMRRGPWHVFHFVGHGAFDAQADEGQVVLADEDGKSQYLRASELGRLLADHRSLRLVVLNACEGAKGGERDIFSSSASILVWQGLPAVLAMQYDITDRAAVELSRAFYEALADGLPVDAALAEARKAVSLAVTNTVEWGTPVLYMRAPHGVLFDLAAPPAPAPAAVEAALVAEAIAEPQLRAIEIEPEEPKAQPAPAKPVDEPAPPPVMEEVRERSRRSAWLWIVALAVALAVIAGIAYQAGIIPGILASTPTVPSKAAVEATITAKAQVEATRAALLALTATSTGEPIVSPTPTPVAPTAVPGPVVLTEDGASVTEPIRLDLVRVPGGEFLMGSDPAKDSQAQGDEQPQRKVTVGEFYIGRHQVTNDQYATFVEATGHDMPGHWEGGMLPAGKEDHPVVNVAWSEALAFTEWLSKETGETFRLCTEAEWEKACRGTNGPIYPWGDDFYASRANTPASGLGGTTAVGSYSPQGDSPYGAADMIGNVWEWMADRYDWFYYSTAPDDNPQGPESGQYRTLRGGSFSYVLDEGVGRCASRFGGNPDYRLDSYGFRVCLTMDDPREEARLTETAATRTEDARLAGIAATRTEATRQAAIAATRTRQAEEILQAELDRQTEVAATETAQAQQNSVSNVRFSPASPALKSNGEHVNAYFDYSTSEQTGVYIWLAPFAGGTEPPQSGTSGSPIYPAGNGAGSGFFTILSGTVTVDQIRFQMWDPDQTRLLHESFLAVNYTFAPASLEGRITLVTGDNGTVNSPVLELRGSFPGSPYRVVLDQPNDLGSGQTNTYSFSVPTEFCEITGFSVGKPSNPGGEDDWYLAEVHLSLDDVDVYFDRVADRVITSTSYPYSGSWTGTEAYRQRCGG